MQLPHLCVDVHYVAVTNELDALFVYLYVLLLEVGEDSCEGLIWSNVSHHLHGDLFR